MYAVAVTLLKVPIKALTDSSTLRPIVKDYITYNSESKPTDSNNDGIPDEWANKYLPQGKTYKDIDEETGYCYLELYINSLVDELMKAGYENAEFSPSKDDFGLKGSPTGIGETSTSFKSDST